MVAGPASEEASATPREPTTPTIDSIDFTSAPGADDTYRADDAIEVTVTFDQEVRVVTGSVPPTIILDIGEDRYGTRYASYAGGSPGFELRFVYIVSPTDFDDNGVSIRGGSHNFALYGGSIRGEDGKNANRNNAGQGSDSEHKVKGSSVSLEGAVTSADGERIVLTFRKTTHGELFLPVDTELAAASADAPVTVRVAGALREVSGGEVVGGTALTLTLASPVEAGEQVTVSYSRPASGARITDRAGNGARAFSRTVENLVTDAPQAPALTASPRVEGAALLWTPPEHTGASPITGYEYRRAVHGTQESSAYGRWTAIADSAALTSYRVGGLEGGTTYSFQLRAVNASGKGLPSEHAYATPFVDRSMQPPKGVRVVQGPDSSSLTVTWNAVPAPGLVTEAGKMEFTGYTVWYRLRGTDEEEAQSVSEGVQRGWNLRWAGASRTGSTRYTLTGLRPDTVYVVSVSAGFRDTGRRGQDNDFGLYKSSGNQTARTGAGDGTALGTVEMPLTASFDGMPRTHDGATAFGFRIAFSEAVAIEADAMRDHALAVAGGSVTAAAPVDGRGDLWSITVTPSGTETISILLAPGRACTESGAICTEDGRQLFSGAYDELPAVVALPPVVILDADTALAGFVLVDTASGADLGPVADGATVRVADPAGGSYDFRAETAPGAAVGSVRLALAGPQDGDATARADDTAPYLLRGGTDGTDGGAALPVGSYTLTATAYAQPGGTGAALGSLSVEFTVAPTVLTGFVLVDATAHADLGALADGARLTELDAAKDYGFRVEAGANGGVESVTLALTGPGPDDEVSRIENHAPWSLYGDSDGNEHGAALADGAYTLTATAWSADDGEGEALQTLRVSFAVGEAQVAPAAEPLSAAFEEVPGHHSGPGTPFTLGVVFSEPVTIGEAAFAAHALIVGNATVTEASRVEGAPGEWRVTIAPASNAQVTVALAAGRGCAEEGALCTADGRALESAPQASIAGLPALAGFELVDLSAGGQRTALGSGATVRLADASGGSYGIVAKTAEGQTVGSVAFVLDAPGEDNDVTHTEGVAPWSLHGDGGEDAINGAPLRAGSHTLTATVWSERGGAGTMLGTLTVAFTVVAAASDTVVTVDTDAATALTASFVGMPAEHGGAGAEFTFRVRFSEDVKIGFAALRDDAFALLDVEVTAAKRVNGSDALREITVKATGPYEIRIDLEGNRACDVDGAICTAGGKMLSSSLSATVAGPPALRVADATVKEGPNATLDFVVTLDRAASGPVTVEYATVDYGATAGEDYEAASGTLTFAAGETAKTVEVRVLDDAVDDGGEQVKFVLFNPVGAWTADAEAFGTIENSDPMPSAWLARFGRTVGSQVVDAVTARFEAPGASHVTLGGQRLSLEGDAAGAEGADPALAGDEQAARDTLTAFGERFGGAADGARDREAEGLTGDGWMREGWMRDGAGADARTMSGRELLLGSAFHLAAGGEDGAASVAAWGRVATGGFDAEVDEVRLDGEVTTAMLGADVGQGRWLAGAALAYSEGTGGYALTSEADSAFDAGEVESRMTTLFPYARLALNERVSAWGLVGYGTGTLTLTEENGAGRKRYTTGIGMQLGAVGARGTLLAPEKAGGFELALRTDALLVRTTSDATEGMASSESDTSRLRLMLDGSRSFELDGATLTPRFEVGLRHDGGDAETGTGVEVGGGVSYTDPASGLTVEAKARGLIAHEEEGYREWGASGSVRIDPGASGRGLSLTLSPTWGAASSGTERLWGLRDASGLGGRDGAFEPERRLDAEVGYGFSVLDGGAVAMPYAGWSRSSERETLRLGQRLRLGQGTEWRLEGELGEDARILRAGYGYRLGSGLTLTTEASRREPANDDAPEHALMLRGSMRW